MKNAGIRMLRILLGLMGLTLIYNGSLWAFFPEENFTVNEIMTNSLLGINTIKSDIGGPLMAVGLMQILFVIGREQFLWPLVIISLSYFVVRTVSLVVDGPHAMIVTGIVIKPILHIVLFRITKTS